MHVQTQANSSAIKSLTAARGLTELLSEIHFAQLQQQQQQQLLIMDNATIFICSSFLIILSLALLALFVHLIVSGRKESSIMILRLDRSIKKLLQMQNTTDRNFDELQMYLDRRMKNLLVLKKKLSKTIQIQTDEVDVELGESASPTQVRESKTETEQSQVKERDDRVLEVVETACSKPSNPATQIQTDEVDVEIAGSASHTKVEESKTEKPYLNEEDDCVLDLEETYSSDVIIVMPWKETTTTDMFFK